MGEADAVQLFLADRRGDDTRRRSGAGEAHGRLKRLECGSRAIHAWGAWDDVPSFCHLEAWECSVEQGDGFFRRRDRGDRARPDAAQGRGIAHGEEAGQAACFTHHPAFRDDFRPNARRIAQWHGERRQLGPRRAWISYSR